MSTDRPLTPLMLAVLRGMRPSHTGPAMTGNEIGLAAGQRWGDVQRRSAQWSSGMGPAQRIIFPLLALERRGLVRMGTRTDGLSGTAYRITDAGVAKLREIDAEARL